MILYYVLALGQGLTTPWGRNVDDNRNILSFWLYVANLKKSLWTLILRGAFKKYTEKICNIETGCLF